MSSAARTPSKMTAAEYLTWEKEQVVRHEFYNGEAFAMSGGSRRHSLIATNTVSTINQALRSSDCQAHGSDMRIHIAATGSYTYPDGSVVCPPVEGESDDVISNPVLLVEVLSPSTADFDRGGKFAQYRQIPSFQEYLVISQDEPRIEHHQRTKDGSWLLREVVGIDQIVELVSIDCRLALSEVYAKVAFEDS